MVEIITGNFIDSVPIGPSGNLIVPVHQLSIRISAKDGACPTSKITESDLELAKTIILFVDSWNGRLDVVPNRVW